MTDKKLIELAAKAAGINLYWTKDGNKLFRRDGGEQKPWNPLANDGDALRLAVELRMWVETCISGVLCDETNIRVRSLHITQEHEDDPYASVRRAIVIAAAEIGKDME